MLRMFMLLLLMLCAQFFYEIKTEHKVLFKLSNFPSVFRIDDNFNRTYASLSIENKKLPLIQNEKWKVSKYIKSDNISEKLSIKTTVNTGLNDNILLGKKKQIKLNLVTYKENHLLVLKNKNSNELVELIPYREDKKISQTTSLKLSAVSKQSSFQDESQMKNGIEVANLELVFVEARIPKLSKKPIYNNAINGHINLNSGEINNGELVFTDLLKIGNDSIEPLEFNYITINNGGQFAFEYMGQMVSGIFSKASKGTYVMRVATGLLSGASFTFAKEGSDAVTKTAAILNNAKEEQDRLVKERSLASKRALERSGYQF